MKKKNSKKETDYNCSYYHWASSVNDPAGKEKIAWEGIPTKKEKYCCIPSMILYLGSSKEVAMATFSAIWDKIHAQKKVKICKAK